MIMKGSLIAIALAAIILAASSHVSAATSCTSDCGGPGHGSVTCTGDTCSATATGCTASSTTTVTHPDGSSETVGSSDNKTCATSPGDDDGGGDDGGEQCDGGFTWGDCDPFIKNHSAASNLYVAA